jgi:hypothetical protein
MDYKKIITVDLLVAVAILKLSLEKLSKSDAALTCWKFCIYPCTVKSEQ